MKRWRLVILIAIIFSLGTMISPDSMTTHAQGGDEVACNTMIETVLTEVGNTCINLGRNEVCYGNGPVSAILKDDTLFFDAPGDIIPVEAIETVITRTADPDSSEWGIVLMDVQADLPAESDSVRLLLYGGVTMSDAVEASGEQAFCTLTNTSGSNINLRAGPGTAYRTVDIFDQNTSLDVFGRSEDEDWFLTPRGWVAAWLIENVCNIDEMPVRSAEDTVSNFSAPMQAFTVQMDENARCQAAPTGMMIQSPRGQTASLMVNNVEMQIGSTAFLTMRDDNSRMIIRTLEGNVVATSGGVSREIVPGMETEVVFDEEGEPGEPDEPDEFDVEDDVLYIDYDDLEGILDTEDFYEVDYFDLCVDDETDEVDGDCLDEFLDEEELNDLDEDCLDDLTGDYDPDCLEETTFYDSDDDGLDDDEDFCPDEAGPPENDGCPEEDEDSDGDGLTDDEDDCPFEFGPPENYGCPEDEGGDEGVDSDGDGLTDDEDDCPFEFGPPENFGCPEDEGGDEGVDSDGDGLLDDEDDCPFEFGPPENFGCPEDEEEI